MFLLLSPGCVFVPDLFLVPSAALALSSAHTPNLCHISTLVPDVVCVWSYSFLCYMCYTSTVVIHVANKFCPIAPDPAACALVVSPAVTVLFYLVLTYFKIK